MYGIVMAGGLSSRMGRNKLRLSIHGDGKDMLERTVELLGGFTDDVFVSCRAPEDAAPFKAIPDEVDRQGPFGGVYSALRRLQKPILVLSCDLPFMDGPTLRRLLDAREARLPGTIMTTYQQEVRCRVETGYPQVQRGHPRRAAHPCPLLALGSLALFQHQLSRRL